MKKSHIQKVFHPLRHISPWVRKDSKNKKSTMVSHLLVVQLLSHVQLFATPWTAALQAPLSITDSWSLLKLMSIESVVPCNHLILCCPLLLPSIFPSIRVFSKESVICIRWPKYWIFSFSISPSNEYSRLISFRMGWLDLLTVQGTLKSLLQHHSWKASILRHSALFKVQLSHPYMTTGKPTALIRQTFVSFLICYLGLSQFFFQGASSFTFVAGNDLLEISLILHASVQEYLSISGKKVCVLFTKSTDISSLQIIVHFIFSSFKTFVIGKNSF